MTILVDDAGWGSIIGGVLYGVCRVETGEFEYGEVPPQFFQEPLFDTAQYQAQGAAVVADLFERLAGPTDEPIRVCTGSCLAGIRQWLDANEFGDWETAKIGEPLQTKIETALQAYLRGFGFEIDLETLTTKQGLAFHKAVGWLHGGNAYSNPKSLPEREAVCKTGWSTFRAWADHLYPQAKSIAQQVKARRYRERRAW